MKSHPNEAARNITRRVAHRSLKRQGILIRLLGFGACRTRRLRCFAASFLCDTLPKGIRRQELTIGRGRGGETAENSNACFPQRPDHLPQGGVLSADAVGIGASEIKKPANEGPLYLSWAGLPSFFLVLATMGIVEHFQYQELTLRLR
jgi:hypothetical protein